MEQILQEAKKVAVEAAEAAGRTARAFFDQEKQVFDKGADGDLVTHVDHLMEDDILRRIAASFPDHQIRSEETGWSGVEGDWLWLVDPLDGTNNYAVGLPVYGVAITLLYRKNPVLGVIHDSHLEQTYVAVQGEGAVCGGQPIAVKPARNPHRLTIGWIQGHHVQKRDSAMRLKQSLDLHCKRVLRLWAPSLLWCMAARGDLDGIVLYDSEGDDLYSGILMVKEAGGIVVDYEGQDFEGMHPEPYLVACHPQHKEELLRMVRGGLSGEL